MQIFWSCIKDCIEDMVTFTALVKIFPQFFFFKVDLAGRGKIFYPEKRFMYYTV